MADAFSKSLGTHMRHLRPQVCPQRDSKFLFAGALIYLWPLMMTEDAKFTLGF
jgi:hypothetical protein